MKAAYMGWRHMVSDGRHEKRFAQLPTQDEQ